MTVDISIKLSVGYVFSIGNYVTDNAVNPKVGYMYSSKFETEIIMEGWIFDKSTKALSFLS